LQLKPWELNIALIAATFTWQECRKEQEFASEWERELKLRLKLGVGAGWKPGKPGAWPGANRRGWFHQLELPLELSLWLAFTDFGIDWVGLTH